MPSFFTNKSKKKRSGGDPSSRGGKPKSISRSKNLDLLSSESNSAEVSIVKSLGKQAKEEYYNILMAFFNLNTFANDFMDFIDKKIRPNRRNIFSIHTRRFQFKDHTLIYVKSIENITRLITNTLLTVLRSREDPLNMDDKTLAEYRNVKLESDRRTYKSLETKIMHIYNLIVDKCERLKEPKCRRDFDLFVKNHEDSLIKYKDPLIKI
jgi:hypothetical protein